MTLTAERRWPHSPRFTSSLQMVINRRNCTLFQGKMYLKLLKSGFSFSLCSLAHAGWEGITVQIYTHLMWDCNRTCFSRTNWKLKAFISIEKNGTCKEAILFQHILFPQNTSNHKYEQKRVTKKITHGPMTNDVIFLKYISHWNFVLVNILWHCSQNECFNSASKESLCCFILIIVFSLFLIMPFLL